MTDKEEASRAVLEIAARAAGLDTTGAAPIRFGENDIWRLPGGIVARIGRPRQHQTAAKETAVARWLEDNGVDAVRPVRGLPQPVNAKGRPVTWWHELPAHEMGTSTDVAAVLRQAHKLAPPVDFELPSLDPFVRLPERIAQATTVNSDERAWLIQRLAELRHRYASLPPGRPRCVVHGDAWRGNIAKTPDGRVILLDLERCSLGPPEWDLTSLAVSYLTTGHTSAAEWTAYCGAYGLDVTEWTGFEVLRDIRELRMTSMALQLASREPDRYGDQAAHRLACVRGERGARPWEGWTPVP